MDDECLRAELAGGLEHAFERLVVTYQDRLFRFALHLTSSAPDAEEATQDAFVRAYKALDRYPAEQIRTLALQAWLYRITLNVVRNRVRRGRVPLAELDGDLPATNDQDQPEQVAEQAERRRETAQLLADLPPRYRTAVTLRHIEDMSYGEIAQVLNQPEGTVKANVYRGLQRLRTAVEQKGNMTR